MSTISGYIGTYTHGPLGRAQGIYRFTLNRESGVLEELQPAAETVNPSYLALSPSKKYLYAVNEADVFENPPGGAVSAFVRDPQNGALGFINRRPSYGQWPCHIIINEGETHAVAANYGTGTLGVFPLEAGGALGDAVQVIQLSGSGPNRDRQGASHAHFFTFDRAQSFGFAWDLGADRIMAYRFDKDAPAPLSPGPVPWVSAAPGAGPRHGVFNAGGTRLYSLNELDSTLDVLACDPLRGALEGRQSLSCLPRGIAAPGSAAAIRLSPDGRFLYASNRGHDSIAVFRVKDGAGDEPELVEVLPSGGKIPRDFNLDPSGNFLIAAHQDSDNLVVFRVDRAAGLLEKAGEYRVPSPVCVIFV